MDAAEIIAMVRDIALLVMLVVTTLAVIIIYFKVSKVLNSAKRTLESVEGIISTISEKLVAPAAAGSGSGVRRRQAGLVPVQDAQIRKR